MREKVQSWNLSFFQPQKPFFQFILYFSGIKKWFLFCSVFIELFRVPKPAHRKAANRYVQV